jgi:predicted hydrocarbon binding protein
MSETERKHDFAEEIIKSDIISNYIKGWLNAVSESLKDLDRETAEKITMKTAQVCYKFWHDHMAEHGYDLSSHDLASFVKALDEHVKEQGKGEGYAILEDENTVFVVFKPGECACPLVLSGYLKPSPNLCLCPNHCFKLALETVTGKPVKSEYITSLAAGSDSCTFRARVL